MPLMDAFSRAMFRRAASGGDAENASEASSGGGQLPPLESASAFELEIPPMGASSGMWEGDSVLGSPGGSDASGLPSPGMSETPGSLRGGRKSLKKKRNLLAPRKSTLRASVYEPPNLNVAMARMRSIQPHEVIEPDEEGKTTRKLSLKIGTEEMMNRFSEGVVFWFLLLRDYLIVFVVLTIVASGYFNLVRRANEEAGTTWERLDGISRASFGAVLFWSAKKSRDGAPPSGADKDETLAIVILDALSMVLLLGVAVYHHIYKERVKEDVDDNTITMDDYAVEVRGLPPDATEESVRAHFERHCGPVHEITFGRDVLEVMELRKKALALEANHELLEWMLRRAQKLLGEASDDERDGPARWRRLWRKAYDKTKRELVAAGVLKKRVDLWGAALAAARDESLSMRERTASAAKAAQRSMKKGTVGAAGSSNADDFNPELIRQKMRQSVIEREENANEIAACAQEGYSIVCAWVAFVEEQHCVDCVALVNDSKRVDKKDRAAKGTPRSRMQMRGGDDIRLFRVSPLDQGWKLKIKPADPPSDVLWENLHYRDRTMWKRKLRSFVVLIFFLVVNIAAIAAAMAAMKSLHPIAACDDIGADGELLSCPAIWDLASSSASSPAAREDIQPFLARRVTANDCEDHVKFGGFVGDMRAHSDFYSGSGAAAFRASFPVGGLDPSSQVDECAAFVCYACYCGDRGYSKYSNDSDGLGSFCEKYWTDQINRWLVVIAAVLVSTTMNIILKELCIWLAWFEHPQSLTARELSTASYMIVALVVNMALLPLFMTADISELSSLPWLFKGDHYDVAGPWYGEFSKKFAEIAIINAVSFPFTLLSPVILWRLKLWFFVNKVKSQRELNELTTPPPFLLSERYGQLIAQVLYSLIFSAGIPLVYVGMVVFLALSIVIDRVMLLRYCANPPRYTGKLAALLVHLIPIGVALHFAMGTWIFGQRDAPSHVLDGGVSGSYAAGGGAYAEDGQWDAGARLARVNGMVSFVGFVTTASLALVAETALAVKKRLDGLNMDVEGCPPLPQAIARGLLTDLPSYKITAHPEYKHLFPKGDDVTEPL